MIRHPHRVIATVMCLLMSACVLQPQLLQPQRYANKDCGSEEAHVACVEQGPVKGAIDGETLAFKAIPYAAPPTGALRWHPPTAPAAWQGTRDGTNYGAMCPQLIGKMVEGNEDCLFVNVWRPLRKPVKPLPVMVWLTGGGNHVYSGAGTPGFGKVVYNGKALVPHDVIVVTYNLRLGVLGFLAHPVLDDERAEKISGNYGSLDQVAMLQWIHRNITAFGGDPDRVFLFGTSAGGGNICALLSSPLTKGLIHGVSMQSSVPTGCELPTLADAENGTGRDVVNKVGCADKADIAACLREKTVTELVTALPGTFTVLPRIYGPNIDGVVFPGQPIERIRRRLTPAVPVIIGNTADETMQFINSLGPVTNDASFSAAVARVFGIAMRDRIVEHYRLASYATPRAALVQVTTDALFTCQSRRVARTFAATQQAPVYRYLFSHTLKKDPVQKALGAIHTVEHPFLFNWEGAYIPTDTDREIQRQMVEYWTRMAIGGDPNQPGTPFWSAAGPNGDVYLDIGAATESKNGAAAAQCDFWDTVPLPSPHL